MAEIKDLFYKGPKVIDAPNRAQISTKNKLREVSGYV